MAYKTFLRDLGSTVSAGVGFLPVQKPSASIEVASATTVIPAIIDLSGTWSTGKIINIEITTNIPATTNTISSSQLNQSSEDFAILVAVDLSAETNITAVAVGSTIEIVASGVAVTLVVDSVVVS